jgi:hypothetical protein
MYDIGDDLVSFSIDVQVSNPFLTWVISFGKSLKVVSCKNIIKK